MAYVKRFVCFANSRKPGGSCVAGREFTSAAWGPWVRPVSQRPSHEISDGEKRFAGGTTISLLDVVDVPMAAPAPQNYQQENHVIDGARWSRLTAFTSQQVQGAVEDPQGPLWLNGNSSTYGVNDRVPEAVAVAQFRRSLYLVRPGNLRIVKLHNVHANKFETRARFTLCGEQYCLKVTDPVAEQWLTPQQPGQERRLDDALICVSLGEVFKSYAYKLAAGIITPLGNS